MTDWKPLTIENLIRAECIFLSVGNGYNDIKDYKFLEKDTGMYGLEIFADKAIKEITEYGKRDSELIFSLPCSNRCRIYIYPEWDPIRKERFPGAEYFLGITSMHHYDGADEDEVEELFSRIERKLLDEKFPALKF